MRDAGRDSQVILQGHISTEGLEMGLGVFSLKKPRKARKVFDHLGGTQKDEVWALLPRDGQKVLEISRTSYAHGFSACQEASSFMKLSELRLLRNLTNRLGFRLEEEMPCRHRAPNHEVLPTLQP